MIGIVLGAYWFASLVAGAVIGIYGSKNGWSLTLTAGAGVGFSLVLGLLVMGIIA